MLLDSDVSAAFGNAASAWTNRGLDEAVKLILSEHNTLFDSLADKLETYPQLKRRLREVLMEGG